MFFEAKLNKKKYQVHVNEARSSWDISLQEEGKDKKSFKIDKEHFRQMDDAISFLYKNSSYMMDVVGDGLDYTVYTRGSYRTIKLQNDEMLLHESLKSGGSLGGSESLSSGMPGKIVTVMVKAGQEVKEGEPLLIMEAMKMENEMRAEQDCKIRSVNVKEGDSVEAGATLISFEEQ